MHTIFCLVAKLVHMHLFPAARYIRARFKQVWRTHADDCAGMARRCVRGGGAQVCICTRTRPLTSMNKKPNRTEPLNSGTSRNRTRNRTEPNQTEPRRVRNTQAEPRRTGNNSLSEPNGTEPMNVRKVRNQNESNRTGSFLHQGVRASASWAPAGTARTRPRLGSPPTWIPGTPSKVSAQNQEKSCQNQAALWKVQGSASAIGIASGRRQRLRQLSLSLSLSRCVFSEHTHVMVYGLSYVTGAMTIVIYTCIMDRQMTRHLKPMQPHNMTAHIMICYVPTT